MLKLNKDIQCNSKISTENFVIWKKIAVCIKYLEQKNIRKHLLDLEVKNKGSSNVITGSFQNHASFVVGEEFVNRF